jgi:hypothetical protein
MATQSAALDGGLDRLMSRHDVDVVAERRDQRVHRGQASVLVEFQAWTKSA